MNTFTLTRHDWSLTNFVLVIVGIVAAVPFAGGLFDWLRGKPLQVQTGAVVPAPVVDDPQLGAGVTGVYTGDAIFTIADPSAAQWGYSLLVPLITLVVAIVSLLMVRRLVVLARRDDPFDPQALLAVRVLGLVLFVYGAFTPLIKVLMTAMVTTEMRAGELNFVLQFDAGAGWPVVVGLVVGAVGEVVFGRGRTLSEDVDGLV